MTTRQLIETVMAAKRRTDVVPAYAEGIKLVWRTLHYPYVTEPAIPAVDFDHVNRAIVSRWSIYGLDWIKREAWMTCEGRR